MIDFFRRRLREAAEQAELRILAVEREADRRIRALEQANLARERALRDAGVRGLRIASWFRELARRPLDDAPLLALAEVVVEPEWREALLAAVELTTLLRSETFVHEPRRELELRVQWLMRRAKADHDHDVSVLLGPKGRVLSRWRGVVDGVAMRAADFLGHGDLLLELRPVLHLKLLEGGEHLDALARAPLLARLRSLDLTSTGLDDVTLMKLVDSPYVRELRWLDVSRSEITDAGIHALAASENLPHLRRLEVRYARCRNPCPQLVYEEHHDWGPAPRRLESPRFGQELEDRYGRRRWISDAPRCDHEDELHSPLPPQRYSWLD